jgi:hypothetical protein
VTRGHYGWWELADRLVNGIVDLHTALPRMNMAQSMVVAHFLGQDVRSGQALSAPGVKSDDWHPPVRGITFG